MKWKFVKFERDNSITVFQHDRIVRMNRRDLALRITNLAKQAPHYDTSIEQAALAEMTRLEREV